MLSSFRSNYYHKKEVILLPLNSQQSGFILVEVLSGILIMTLFIGVAMQLMVYSSLLKARAQQYSEATAWIQQDLEDIKYQASRYKSSYLSAASSIASTSISLSSAQSFEVNDKLKIGDDPTEYTINSISGNSITISPSLEIVSTVDSPVTAIDSTRCGTTPATRTTGFADGLRDTIVGSNLSVVSNNLDTTKTSTRSNQQFRLRRTISLANTVPYNLLEINYTVSQIYGSSSFGISVADTYAEVVPSTSFSCPQ